MQIPPGGGGGYSPHILVGMCRGKVKCWQGLRNELSVERENVGLRNELESCWAWKCGAPERPLTRGAAERAEPRPWEAMNGLKLKKFWKWWSPERQNPPKNVKWWCSGTDFLVICENYMLRSGNSWLKMGVSFAAHTQYAYIMEVTPPGEIRKRTFSLTAFKLHTV